MPCIRRCSNFVFFAALYCSCLGFTALLARDCNRGNKFQKGAMKCCKENKITAPTLILSLGKYEFFDIIWWRNTFLINCGP